MLVASVWFCVFIDNIVLDSTDSQVLEDDWYFSMYNPFRELVHVCAFNKITFFAPSADAVSLAALLAESALACAIHFCICAIPCQSIFYKCLAVCRVRLRKISVSWLGSTLSVWTFCRFVFCLSFHWIRQVMCFSAQPARLLRKKRAGNMVGWNLCQKKCIIKSLRKIFLFCTICKNAGTTPGKGKDNWKAYIITDHVSGEWSFSSCGCGGKHEVRTRC